MRGLDKSCQGAPQVRADGAITFNCGVGIFMGSSTETRNIQELGAGTVRGQLAACARTILIPIGSCERHGNPYTPLGLDGIVTAAVVERAARAAEVLHTPLMPFGYAPHHVGRPEEGHGTVTLRAETYRRMLEDIGRSLIYQGFDKLVFVSFHSFNVDCGQEVLFSLRHKTGCWQHFSVDAKARRQARSSAPRRSASPATPKRPSRWR